jgi:ASC-1-like (ASCH) protein
MEYGSDYHDLATFYWEAGNKEKAVEIARQGLKKGRGRMDEIRSFLAERAMQSGDRAQYIELQFAQATDGLSVKKYESFKKICTEEEWLTYEPQMIKNLEKVWDEEKLKIYMIRAEYGKAVTILSKMRYPHGHYSESDIMRIAAKLEERYPEQILSFYMSGLGNLNHSSNRKVYAQKAAVMAKVRHMLVVVMKSPDKWEIFARKTRNANLKRPAFQEEFAKVVPGWKTL